MITKILVGSLLALSAVSTVAGNMYIFKDKFGKVLLTNVNPKSKNDHIISVKTTYFDNENYVSNQDDIPRLEKGLALQYLKNMQENRAKGIRVSNKSEITKMVGDGIDSGLDIGAKIGMTKSQVLNQTHWGLESPNYVHKVDDKRGELEQWFYTNHGVLYFDNGKLSSIQLFRR